MRLLPFTVAAMLAASSVLPPAQAAGGDQLVASICDYVKSNDKKRLRKKLKESRVKLRNVYSGISCDGQSLLRTAMTNQADNVGSFIAKRLSKKDLTAAEADGQTILAWAEGNGYGASAISTTIKGKVGG